MSFSYEIVNYYFRFSFKMFDRLPSELLEIVMEEVRQRSDRMNLAFSCKAIYLVLKPSLWQRLELEAGCIYHRKNILKNKHFVKDLTLRFNRKGNQNLIDLLRMIFDGDSINLSSLFLEGNVSNDIFSLLMSKSNHLRCVDFHIRDYIPHNDYVPHNDFQWDRAGLVLPSMMTRVHIWDSSVTDAFLEYIINANLETLEDFEITLCDKVNPKGYLNISKLVHLKRLTLIGDKQPFIELDVSFISELKNLEYLNLQNFEIMKDSHLGIWKCIPNLKELYLRHVEGMNDVGDISQLQSLRYLSLSGMEDIPKVFVENITSLKNLRSLDFGCSLFGCYRHTDLDIISGFNEMSSLHMIEMWCYDEDKDLFYMIINKLCEVEQPSKLGEKILPKWSVAIHDNKCILRSMCAACGHCE